MRNIRKNQVQTIKPNTTHMNTVRFTVAYFEQRRHGATEAAKFKMLANHIPHREGASANNNARSGFFRQNKIYKALK